ncbi:MAG TPA: hypothetical protein VGH74_19920 [Planctomycetaceae bacterium]
MPTPAGVAARLRMRLPYYPRLLLALTIDTCSKSNAGWYNEHLPHTSLKGVTPNEIYFKRFPANRKPRIEPRPKWPRGSPCALPHALVAGQPGARFDVEVEHVDGHSHLPIIRLRRAA